MKYDPISFFRMFSLLSKELTFIFYSHFTNLENESSSVTLNKMTMNAERLYCHILNLSQGRLYQRQFYLKAFSRKKNCCLEYASKHNIHFFTEILRLIQPISKDQKLIIIFTKDDVLGV